jgi:site-specific DNA recombinase
VTGDFCTSGRDSLSRPLVQKSPVTRHLVRSSAEHAQRGWRLPAVELERVIGASVKALLEDRQALLTALQRSGIEVSDVRQSFELAYDYSRRLLSETEGTATLIDLIEKVELRAGGIRLAIKIPLPSAAGDASLDVLKFSRFVPMQAKRRGVELRLILDGLPRKADSAPLKAVARARRWFQEIASGKVGSTAEIARREGLQKGYVARLLRLVFISPTFVEAVMMDALRKILTFRS